LPNGKVRHIFQQSLERGILERQRYQLKKISIETRYGPIFAPAEDEVITKSLMRCGEWAWDEVEFVASTLPDDSRVLDAGAFLGTFSLGLALNKRLSFLCAVEGNSQVVPLLKDNIRSNTGVPAVFVDAMLAECSTAPRPSPHAASNLGSTSFATCVDADDTAEYATRAVTLAELRSEYGEFDLIKLDVEGMEQEILRGDRDHLADGVTTLWVECKESLEALQLVEMLLSWKQDVYYFAFPSHNPDNFRREREPVFPWAYEAGLLVRPRNPPCLNPSLSAHRCILRTVDTVEALEEAMWCTPRWLPAGLAHADAVELAAVAGRALRGQSRDNFLVIDTAFEGSTSQQTTGEKLFRIEEALFNVKALSFERGEPSDLVGARLAEGERVSAVKALALELVNEAQQERLCRESAENRLAVATAFGLARLADLGKEREEAQRAIAEADTRLQQQREEAQRAIAETDARLEAALQQRADVQARLDTVERAIVWRLAAPIHNFIGNHPVLQTSLRRLRALAGVALRRHGLGVD
jgi:FkbM family methyltransferase